MSAPAELGTDTSRRGVRPPPQLGGLLRSADFRRLFRTRLTSQAADGIFQASLASAVFFNPERTTDPAQAAAGFAVLLLPYSMVGPFAGVLLDRWWRQRVLVRANLVRAVLVCCVALLVATVGPASPLFFLAALGAISVNRFYGSALSAGLPHVVDRDSLVLANSLSTTSGFVANLAGSGVGLALRHFVGAGGSGDALVALAAAAVYVVAAGIPRAFPLDLLGPDERTPGRPARQQLASVVRGLAEGARHIWGHRPAAYALLAIGVHRFFYGISTVATLLLYRNYFTDSGWLRAGLPGIAQVLVCGGGGVVLAALVTPMVTRVLGKAGWIVTVFAGASVTEVVFGLPYRQGLVLVAAFLLGFAAQASKICVDTILQESVEDAYRGRVFSFYDTAFNLTFVAAAVAGAVVLPPNGKSYAVIAGIAAGYALTALGYGIASGLPGRVRSAGPRPTPAAP